MKKTILIVLLVLFIVVVILFAASLFGQKLSVSWYAALLLLGIVIPAAIKFINDFIKMVQGVDELRGLERSLAYDPLRQVSYENLLARLPGSDVAWVDRGDTHPDQLGRNPRLLISGVTNLGKSREAMELIKRSVDLGLLNSDRIFVPERGFKERDAGSLQRALRESVDLQTNLLLFLDDLPYQFRGSNELDLLAAGIKTLQQGAPKAYVVATARDDQKTAVHEKWLADQKFETIPLTPLKADETAQVVDNAAESFGVQLDGEARSLLIEAGDGTAELPVANIRRLGVEGVTQADSLSTQHYLKTTSAAVWNDTRAGIIKDYPAASYLLRSLATFYAARVRPNEQLVMVYAGNLRQQDGARKRLPWQRKSQIGQAVNHLAYHGIEVSEGQFRFKDLVAEGENVGGPEEAGRRLGNFLLTYRRLWRRPLLRPFYRMRDDHAWALYDLALIEENQSNQEMSIIYNSVALQLMPHYGIYYNRGNSYYDQGRYEEALADYDWAIEINPEFASAYSNRGNTYDEQGRTEETLADYDRAIELDPEDAIAYNNRGIIYRKQRRYEEALTDYGRAIELDPEDAGTYYNRGNIYLNQERYEEALVDYGRAIELDPEDADTYYNRGLTYDKQGRDEEALADYGRAIELDPDYTLAYINRGSVYRRLRQTEKSLEAIDRAIELDPDYGWYRYERALVYLMLGLDEKAEDDLRQAVVGARARYDEIPTDWRNAFDLTLYHLAEGDVASAARIYEETEAGDPPLPIMRAAIDDLDEFVELFPQNEDAQRMREMLRRHVEGRDDVN
jgi:tetratricopeptide (TPR) repeat protein